MIYYNSHKINKMYFGGDIVNKMSAIVGDNVDKAIFQYVTDAEPQGGLPTPFSLNYNAKNYDAQTMTLKKTDGQLVDADAVMFSAGTIVTPHIADGYIYVSGKTGTNLHGAWISDYNQYMNRDAFNRNFTIVARAKSTLGGPHLLANRTTTGNYNWMFRWYANSVTLHGFAGEKGKIDINQNGSDIVSIRVDNSNTIYYDNWTQGTSSNTLFEWGTGSPTSFALFSGYAVGGGSAEVFVGDFYWIYVAQSTLTDEQIQQVIDYNENL